MPMARSGDKPGLNLRRKVTEMEPVATHLVNLAEDAPALLERRRFLTLLGAGTAAGAASAIMPGCSGPGPAAAAETVAKLNQNENQIAPSEVERRAMMEALDLANRYPADER